MNCLRFRATMMVAMEWNKGDLEQKRTREERPEIGVQNLYGIKCRQTVEKQNLQK